jgi:hypothetical protein
LQLIDACAERRVIVDAREEYGEPNPELGNPISSVRCTIDRAVQARATAATSYAGRHLEGGKQRRGAIALIVVAMPVRVRSLGSFR